MAQKEVTFEFEGQRYTLTFTRKTVQQLSQAGFKPDMVTDQPAVGIPMLFNGAFVANHRFIKTDVRDRIFESITNKTDFIGKLLTLYLEPINEMLEDPPEDSEKNVKWEANF